MNTDYVVSDLRRKYHRDLLFHSAVIEVLGIAFTAVAFLGQVPFYIALLPFIASTVYNATMLYLPKARQLTELFALGTYGQNACPLTMLDAAVQAIRQECLEKIRDSGLLVEVVKWSDRPRWEACELRGHLFALMPGRFRFGHSGTQEIEMDACVVANLADNRWMATRLFLNGSTELSFEALSRQLQQFADANS